MRHPQRQIDPRVARLIDACAAGLPIVKAAKELLRRKADLSAVELARAVPGLDAWAAAHGTRYRGLDVAIKIATGADAFAVVAFVTGTHRTGTQVKALYKKWQGQRLRASRG